jgi:C1A family cysteine protease
MDPHERRHEAEDVYRHYAGGSKYGDHRAIDMLHEKRAGA